MIDKKTLNVIFSIIWLIAAIAFIANDNELGFWASLVICNVYSK